MKTFSAKKSDVVREWHVIDASKYPLGRLSTAIANVLLGKNKPMFTHHTDVGDYVVVINADDVQVTGNKSKDKLYYRHSGYPGSIKSKSLEELKASNPEKVIFNSVRGMLPSNKLRDDRLKRLKIFPGQEHDHTAQKPKELSVAVKKGNK
jgi:large subunit ribosomal protein L13